MSRGERGVEEGHGLPGRLLEEMGMYLGHVEVIRTLLY